MDCGEYRSHGCSATLKQNWTNCSVNSHIISSRVAKTPAEQCNFARSARSRVNFCAIPSPVSVSANVRTFRETELGRSDQNSSTRFPFIDTVLIPNLLSLVIIWVQSSNDVCLWSINNPPKEIRSGSNPTTSSFFKFKASHSLGVTESGKPCFAKVQPTPSCFAACYKKDFKEERRKTWVK